MTIHRAYLTALTCILLSACDQDALIPCQGDGDAQGRLCREYRFSNGVPVGYIDFTYRGDTMVEKSYFDQLGIVQSTVTERYAEGVLRSVSSRFESGTQVVSSYHYQPDDSLQMIVYGAVDSVVMFHYGPHGLRSRVEFLRSDTVHRAISYRYFEDEPRLYQTQYYSGADSLTEYRSREYFIQGKVRTDHFSPSHQFLGHTIEEWMDGQRLISSRFTAPDQTVTHTLVNTYDAQGRLSEAFETFPYGSDRSVYMYN